MRSDVSLRRPAGTSQCCRFQRARLIAICGNNRCWALTLSVGVFLYGVLEWKGLPRRKVAVEAAGWHRSAMMACLNCITTNEGEVHGYRYRWNRSRQEGAAIHGVDAAGKVVLVKPKVAREATHATARERPHELSRRCPACSCGWASRADWC